MTTSCEESLLTSQDFKETNREGGRGERKREREGGREGESERREFPVEAAAVADLR